MSRAIRKRLIPSPLIRAIRPVCSSSQIEKLVLEVKKCAKDNSLNQGLVDHGLAPLMYYHLKNFRSQISETNYKELQVLYLKNRDRNRILLTALENILRAFNQESISVLVLKGGALCNLIYPDPALRPMGDLDLLIKNGDEVKAFKSLTAMGFKSRPENKKHHALHAMPEMYKKIDGVVVNVDLHRNVFTNLHPASLVFEKVREPFHSFKVGNQSAYTLSHEEMLLHLCHHLITPGQAIKLIETYQGKYKRAIYFFDKSGEIKLTGSGFDTSIKHISQLEYGPRFIGRPEILPDTSFTYKKDGDAVNANVRYVEEFGWYLIVEQLEKEITRQIFKTLVMNLLICVVITILILILVNLSITAYQNRIETLRGIVPICSFCKQIRDDKGYWNRVEAYVAKYTDAKFSHSVCPTCMEEHYPVEFATIQKKKKAKGMGGFLHTAFPLTSEAYLKDPEPTPSAMDWHSVFKNSTVHVLVD